ncbi:MAG: hypothetical protein QF464_21475, partial [Myxococcota bacterium]|nr:hypothetical protein [Myxococcota bacterium]
MARLTYEDHETLREARKRYWAANGFGDDGGYSKTWEIVKLGPIPIPIRNIEARKKTIQFHDLHHLVTGYDTDFTGETEISAWELATGCSDKWVAWVLDFQILVLGMATPKRMLQAWARGRKTRCLYAEPFDDALLAHTVGEMRTKLGLDQLLPTPGVTDILGLGAWTLMSFAVQLGGLLAVIG